MNELLNIINEKGYPKAIVDYKRNFKKAIFDFDEILYMDYKKNIFINDKKIYGDPIDIWQSYIDSWKKTKNNGEIAAVGFFSYGFWKCTTRTKRRHAPSDLRGTVRNLPSHRHAGTIGASKWRRNAAIDLCYSLRGSLLRTLGVHLLLLVAHHKILRNR